MNQIAPDNQKMKLDAGESVFFERQLESVEARLYQTKYKELKYRRLIPVSNRDGAGASSIIYYMYSKVGMAKIIANPADDLPRSDVFAKETIAKVFSIGTSFGFSTKEMRRAQFSGVPLEMLKVDSARRAVRVKESDIAWTGEASHDIVGLFENTNITNTQAPLNAGSTSRAWSAKTSDEIIADIITMISGIRTLTKGVQAANTLLLPVAQYDIIALKPRSSLTDTTILEFITKPGNAYGLDTVDWLVELEDAGTGASDMAFAYERDPEVLELRIPMEMQMLPPERRNLEMLTNIESEIAGVVVRYPLACYKLYDI
jgi:hypothetical protein